MKDEVTAVFTISQHEYIRAMRRHFQSKLQVKRDLVGSAVAIYAGVCFLQASPKSWLGWLLVSVGAVLLTLVVYAIFLLPRLLYHYQPKLQSEYRLQFGDDAIRFQTDEINSELKWPFYHSWLRDDQFYLLYYGKRDLAVIPRRALKDGADQRLAELLSNKIGPALS
jgi:hypothetical protein